MFDYFNNADTNVWADILDVGIRSIASIVVLFLLAKLLGNKQIKQLSFFDYVVGISIGSIAAEMATATDTPHHFFLISMLLYTAVSLLVGWISLKTTKGRRFLEGLPIVLIERGKIVYCNLKKAQMTVNGLLSECRSLGYFDIAEIDTAILETSGELSVLPKAEFKPLSAKDAQIAVPPSKPHANVVIDGVLMVKNVHSVKKTQAWLLDKLHEQGVDLDNVALATLDEDGNLEIYEKSVKPKKNDMFD